MASGTIHVSTTNLAGNHVSAWLVPSLEGYTPGYIYPGVYVCFLVRIRLGIHTQNGREYL
jgi:hypothetical protein